MNTKRELLRDPQRGKIAGVCAGNRALLANQEV